jgi:hypothetical protein
MVIKSVQFIRFKLFLVSQISGVQSQLKNVSNGLGLHNEDSLGFNVLLAQQIQNNEFQSQLRHLQMVQTEVVKALSNVANHGMPLEGLKIPSSLLDIINQNFETGNPGEPRGQFIRF